MYGYYTTETAIAYTEKEIARSEKYSTEWWKWLSQLSTLVTQKNNSACQIGITASQNGSRQPTGIVFR